MHSRKVGALYAFLDLNFLSTSSFGNFISSYFLPLFCVGYALMPDFEWEFNIDIIKTGNMLGTIQESLSTKI